MQCDIDFRSTIQWFIIYIQSICIFLICHAYTFFGKISLLVFCTFYWIVYFFTIEFWEFFINCRYEFIIGYVVCKYFLSDCSFSILLLAGNFPAPKFLIFIRPKFINHSFVDFAFSVMPKNFYQIIEPEDYFFLPKLFILSILHLNVWSNVIFI